MVNYFCLYHLSLIPNCLKKFSTKPFDREPFDRMAFSYTISNPRILSIIIFKTQKQSTLSNFDMEPGYFIVHINILSNVNHLTNIYVSSVTIYIEQANIMTLIIDASFLSDTVHLTSYQFQ